MNKKEIKGKKEKKKEKKNKKTKKGKTLEGEGSERRQNNKDEEDDRQRDCARAEALKGRSSFASKIFLYFLKNKTRKRSAAVRSTV